MTETTPPPLSPTSRLLGDGVWGRVYDLGDGTVLKLGRRKTDGVGDGAVKIENEHRTLTFLSTIDDLPVAVPRVLGHGVYPTGSDYDLWLHSTKLSGHTLFMNEIAALSSRRAEKFGRNIGEVLGRFHLALWKADRGNAFPRTESPFADLRTEVGNHPFYRPCIDLLEETMRGWDSNTTNRLTHGDFNTSNLLFEDIVVRGIVDFAEMGRYYPEKDIADIVKEVPNLVLALVESYAATTGFTPSPERLAAGMAENNLYGALICERRNDMAGMRRNQDGLIQYFKSLGRTPPAPARYTL